MIEVGPVHAHCSFGNGDDDRKISDNHQRSGHKLVLRINDPNKEKVLRAFNCAYSGDDWEAASLPTDRIVPHFLFDKLFSISLSTRDRLNQWQV